MKELTSSQIRQIWLDFWKSKEHLILPPANLIPQNDDSLLWINSGVATLKDYFDGSAKPPSKRLANSQKSIRTNDIENVGRTPRHHTLFEMLGNFSIGDYFKNEIIPWAWELLTDEKWFDIDKELLYVTYYPDDLETKQIWLEVVGLPENHLIKIDDNFWDIGVGPSGPDTEIFFDRGPEFQYLPDDDPEMFPGGENERFLEIWNIVFSQFNHLDGLTKPKEYPELPQKNIDTGAGLERLSSVFQKTKTNFETDLFLPIIEKTEEISGKKYGVNPSSDISFKVIADHIRAIVFAIGDGAVPSNEGRGYVIRRLLRRVVLHGRNLGIQEEFLSLLVPIVGVIMGDFYPELIEHLDKTNTIVIKEENRFSETLNDGLILIEQFIEKSKDTGVIKGEDVFKLYDTYGFPAELTQEKAEEAGLTIDQVGFEKEMQAQKDRARAARGNKKSMNIQSAALLDLNVVSEYVGWTDLEVENASVVAIIKDDQLVDSASDNDDVLLVFDKTPFYAEMGGQIADTGVVIINNEIVAEILNVQKSPNGQHIHQAHLLEEIKVDQNVDLKVNLIQHKLASQNHTATHMLDQALRNVVDKDTHQAGSLVTPEYLRYDFTHEGPLTQEQLNQIEELINQEIENDHQITWLETDIKTAEQMGAVAVFGEKYGEIVRVVSIGDFNKEFDGGTHAKSSAELQSFKILSESGIGAGVRRIEAITGPTAMKLYKEREEQLVKIGELVNAQKPEDALTKVESLKEDNKHWQSMYNDLLGEMAKTFLSMAEVESINGFKFIKAPFANGDFNGMKIVANLFKEEKSADLLVIYGKDNDKLSVLIASNTDKIKANDLVKEIAPIIEGKGGGKPDMAQIVGTNPKGIDEVLKTLDRIVK